jgi:hypothetical protein
MGNVIIRKLENASSYDMAPLGGESVELRLKVSLYNATHSMIANANLLQLEGKQFFVIELDMDGVSLSLRPATIAFRSAPMKYSDSLPICDLRFRKLGRNIYLID